MATISGLVLYGIWTAVAYAQTIQPAPQAPVVLDIYNLGMPGAIVVVAWLFRGGLPLTVTVRHVGEEHH